MGLSRGIFKLGVYASTGAGGFWLFTKDSAVLPLPHDDYTALSAHLRKYNPSNNPSIRDVCVKRVPLSSIDEKLRSQDGRLVNAFCASVWGGLGYTVQRAILAHRYESPQSAHQLWTTSQLRSSTYPTGTQVTDHFEVVEHTPTRIVFRCGDSPMKQGVRESDGLFEISAIAKPEQGIAEFSLKSVLFQGLEKTDKSPMPSYIEWLHRQYAKLWMETALLRIQR
ncbi:hypothetical protein FQN49_000075 [Arthroderma sp. PD_2]|nr:hypothetical protein FQN49_000075 [Arthroderma sp. PD_2]